MSLPDTFKQLLETLTEENKLLLLSEIAEVAEARRTQSFSPGLQEEETQTDE